MEKTVILNTEKYSPAIVSIVQVLGGSLLLALLAQLSIPLPFSPIPISMQTFGVFLLPMLLGSKKGGLAVIAYLLEATYGLPVLAGGKMNPLWMIGPTSGYLLAFAPVAYFIGVLQEKQQSFATLLLSLVLGQFLIYCLGASFLSLFVGLEYAFSMGVLPYLIGDLAKISLIISLFYGFKYIKEQFSC